MYIKKTVAMMIMFPNETATTMVKDRDNALHLISPHRYVQGAIQKHLKKKTQTKRAESVREKGSKYWRMNFIIFVAFFLSSTRFCSFVISFLCA